MINWTIVWEIQSSQLAGEISCQNCILPWIVERSGRGRWLVIRFDSERHDHFLEILMENFDFWFEKLKTSTFTFRIGTSHGGPGQCGGHVEYWRAAVSLTLLPQTIFICFLATAKFHCSVPSTMFIISGYGHYLIWPTTKWLPKDGHKMCFVW